MQTPPSIHSAGAVNVTGSTRVLSPPSTRTYPVDRAFFRAFLRLAGNPPIRWVLPDGEVVTAGDGEPVGTLRIRNRRALYKLMRSPEVGFGEGYTDGSIE